jgi:chromosome segregation ATPase
MDARLVSGLADCEKAIERKAEVGFVKTLEMLLRQDMDDTNEGLKQLNEELGEHEKQMETLEGRLEKDEAETSELATDLGLLEAAMSTIEMEQADLREAVSNQIVVEVAACKADSEDKAEALRLEVQASMAGFKAELDETVVKQMSSRIAQSEKSLKTRVTTIEERVNDAASKTELKTQLGLMNINLEEVSQGVQALDEMVNDDAEINALAERLEKIDGA